MPLVSMAAEVPRDTVPPVKEVSATKEPAAGPPASMAIPPEPPPPPPDDDTDTWSRVDVLRAALLWAVTARPTRTVLAIGIVSDPTSVQLEPSAETEPVKVDPVRSIFTQ